MKRFKDYSLKTQFVLLSTLSISFIIVTCLFSYRSFDNATKDHTISYSRSLMQQVNENLQSQLKLLRNSIIEISYGQDYQEYIQSDDPERRLPLLRDIRPQLNFIISNNGNVSDIALFDYNWNYFSYLQKGQRLIPETFSQYKTVMLTNLQGMLTDVLIDGDGTYYFAYILPIFEYEMNEETDGLVYKDADQDVGAGMFLCKANCFDSIINKITLTPNTLFMIIDGQNRIITANDDSLVGKTADLSAESSGDANQNQGVTALYNGTKSVIQYLSIDNTQWKVICVIPSSELSYDMRNIRNFIFLICICVFFTLVLAWVLIDINIFNPIYRISGFLKTSGDDYQSLKKRLDNGYKNEIGEMAHYINTSMDKLQNMTGTIISTQKRLYEAEIAKKQMELSALQSQINPHFLYNTLECIRSIAVFRDQQEIAEISTSLARIFRYGIKSDNIVTLDKELDCISHYIKIMNIRYNNKISFHIDIEPRLKNQKIPKMTLQPLIENAIHHGLEPRVSGGSVTISGQTTGEILLISVQDDGIGISPEDLKKIQDGLASADELHQTNVLGNSIGIRNINMRIKLECGPQYGLTLESEPGTGTIVSVVLPMDR